MRTSIRNAEAVIRLSGQLDADDLAAHFGAGGDGCRMRDGWQRIHPSWTAQTCTKNREGGDVHARYIALAAARHPNVETRRVCLVFQA